MPVVLFLWKWEESGLSVNAEAPAPPTPLASPSNLIKYKVELLSGAQSSPKPCVSGIPLTTDERPKT